MSFFGHYHRLSNQTVNYFLINIDLTDISSCFYTYRKKPVTSQQLVFIDLMIELITVLLQSHRHWLSHHQIAFVYFL